MSKKIYVFFLDGQVLTQPPVIDVDGSQIVTTTGESVTLRCTGNKALQWEVPVHFVSVLLLNLTF